MRHILVYFARRVVDSVPVYVYTTRKSYQGSIKSDIGTETFSITYWDSNQDSDNSVGSITMWLNDKTKEQAYAYRDVFGSEAVLVVDEDDSFKLMSIESFNALEQQEQNLVQPSVFAS